MILWPLSPPRAYAAPAVGQLDQFAKETFAEETATVTHGAVAWQLSPELNMSEVRLDGLLLVRDPTPLAALASPWPAAREHGEIVIEIKMPGDHVDFVAVERALLRRQARQVQRSEDPETPWIGQEPLWIVAPHVPAALAEGRTLEAIAPGCYRVGPAMFSFLWIAANELPLLDELVPFLIVRSGCSLDMFARWVKTRRPIGWLLSMLQFLPMSTSITEEIRRYVFPKVDDPEIRARQRATIEYGLKVVPEIREELVGKARLEGRLEEARTSLRHVLRARKLALCAEEEARIDSCFQLDKLEHWIEQAAVATSSAEALR